MERQAIFSKKTMLLLALTLTIFLMARASTLHVAYALGYEDQIMFADPYWINGTSVGIGNTVTVNINITNAYNLWAWQCGLKFDPTVLKCNSVAEGEFMKRQGATIWLAGTINNVGGNVTFSGSSATVSNVSGSGQLMTAVFEVVASGISDIHLMNTKTNTQLATVTVTTSQVRDKYTILYNTNPYVVTIYHNATGITANPPAGIPGMALDITGKKISFNMTFKNWVGTTSTTAFCNVTIPKNLLWLENVSDNWLILVAGVPPAYTSNATDTLNSYVYFSTTYTSQATRTVNITGTGVVPELQPLLALLLTTTALAALMLFAKRKLRGNKTQLLA